MSKVPSLQEEVAETYAKSNPIAALWYLFLESAKLKPSHDVKVQLVRSLVVSCAAFAADFGGLIFLKEVFGMQYLVAATISFIFGTLVDYVLSVTWVFADRQLKSKHLEFVIFVIICAIGLVINLAILALLVQGAKFDYRLAKIIATIVVFFWNFIARKKILY